MEIRNHRAETNAIVKGIIDDLEAAVVEANKRIAFGKIADTTKAKARMRGHVDGLRQAQLIVSKYGGYHI